MPRTRAADEPWFLFEMKDVQFRVVRFSAHEAISSPFEVHLALAAEDEIEFDTVIGNEDDGPLEVALHGDEHVVPIYPERPAPHLGRGDELGSPPEAVSSGHHPAKQTVSLGAAQPVAIAHQLERRLVGIPAVLEEAVVADGFLESH